MRLCLSWVACGCAGFLLALVILPAVAAGPFVAYRDDDDVNVYNVATETHTNLTNHPAVDAVPSWSGDGRQIAFGSDRNGQWDIYTMRADGTNVVQRTHTARIEWGTAFSPDGRYIAYGLQIEKPVDMTPIAVVDLRTGDESVVTKGEGRQDTSISWFPDSDRILFIRRTQGFGIYQVRVDGAMDEELVFLSHEPALAPDGRRIAHQWGRGGNPEIHIYDMVTRTQTPVRIELPPRVFPLVPTWIGPRRLLVRDGLGDIQLVEVETGEREQLPLNTYWVRGFDPVRPWDVSARGKRPFTWGWLKALPVPRR